MSLCSGCVDVKTDWSWLKRPRLPGSANAMLRSSPISDCHFRSEVRCWWRGMARILSNCFARCSGNSIVRCIVSIFHPRTIFTVDHDASPFSSFFVELGSFLKTMSPVDNGQSTVSMQWKRVLREAIRCCNGSWHAMIKSSI